MRHIAAIMLFCFALVLLTAPIWIGADLRALKCGGPNDPFNTCGERKNHG